MHARNCYEVSNQEGGIEQYSGWFRARAREALPERHDSAASRLASLGQPRKVVVEARRLHCLRRSRGLEACCCGRICSGNVPASCGWVPARAKLLRFLLLSERDKEVQARAGLVRYLRASSRRRRPSSRHRRRASLRSRRVSGSVQKLEAPPCRAHPVEQLNELCVCRVLLGDAEPRLGHGVPLCAKRLRFVLLLERHGKVDAAATSRRACCALHGSGEASSKRAAL